MSQIANVVNCVTNKDCYSDARYPTNEDKQSCCFRIEIANWNTTSPTYQDYFTSYQTFTAANLGLTDAEKAKVTLPPVSWTH